MLRDELIEELKKAPNNGEVHIKVFCSYECDDCGHHTKHIQEHRSISRIETVPHITLEAE